MKRKKLLNIPLAKDKLSSLKKDSTVWFSFLFSFFLIFSDLFLVFLFWKRFPPQLPLLFSRPWGEKQLVSSSWFLFLPVIPFSISVINFLLVAVFFKKEAFIRRSLAVVGSVIALLFFIAVVKIISLVV